MLHLYLKCIDLCGWNACNVMHVFFIFQPVVISTTCGFSDCLQGGLEFRLDPMLEDHEAVMEKMNTWNFQIFDLVDKTGGRTGRILSYVSTTITK